MDDYIDLMTGGCMQKFIYRVLLYLACTCSCISAVQACADEPFLPISQIMTKTGLPLHNYTRNLQFKCKFEFCKVSVEQLWLLLDKVEKDASVVDDFERVMSAGSLIPMILARGDDSDYQQLLERATQKVEDSMLQTQYLDDLGRYWLTRELRLILAQGKSANVKLEMKGEPLPAHLSGASERLQQAWRLYRSVKRQFDSYLQNGGETDGVYAKKHWVGFNAVVAGFLAGGQNDTIKAIVTCGVSCGADSRGFTTRRDSIILMSLLAQRRFDGVVGALLKYKPDDWHWRNKGLSELTVQLFDFVGVDWQALHIGAALDKQYFHLNELEKFGGDGAVEYLLDMGALPFFATNQFYIRAIKHFITPGHSVTQPNTVIHSNKATEKQQKALLGYILATVDTNGDLMHVEWASGLLADLQRPETKAVLMAILKGPYLKAAQKAATTLRAMGIEVDVPIAPKSAKFKLLVNGKLQTDTSISWLVSYSGGKTHGALKTGPDGTFEIAGDIARVTKGEAFLTVASTNKLKTPKDRFFATRISTSGLGDIVTLDVKTLPLVFNLNLDQLPGEVTDKKAIVRLNYRGGKAGVDVNFSQTYGAISAGVAEQITFSSLATGVYYASIEVPGAASWSSSSFELVDEPKELEVVLKPGRDLKVAFSQPDIQFRLRRANGKIRYDWGSTIVRGLAFGQYKLVIPSSTAQKENRRVSMPGYSGPDFAGREIDITLDENSADIVDLGVIQLE